MPTYKTLFVIKQTEGVDSTLQENVSDLVYAVFYSEGSELVQAVRNGWNQDSIAAAYDNQLRKTIKDMEENLTQYVIEDVNALSVNVTDDIIEFVLEVKGQSGTVTETIELSQAII